MANPFKIAHRGASGYEVENSVASFKKAIELGADIIEADVQLTRDDVPIIRHDRLLDRTTNVSGYTTEFSWKQYQDQVRLKNDEKVSSLKEFCELTRDSNQLLYLDVKTFGNELTVLKICRQILSYDQFIFGSFHNHSIKLIKQIDPKVKTALIMEGNPIDIQMVINNANCDVLALGFNCLEEDTVSLVQELNKQVFTWTVNDAREIKLAKSLGVNGITSDFIDRI